MNRCEPFTTADFARKTCHTCGRRIHWQRGNRVVKAGWRHNVDGAGLRWKAEYQRLHG
jgi:hypothetical protein